jgi:hypothetical protein
MHGTQGYKKYPSLYLDEGYSDQLGYTENN